ncbi:PaaI family thioesterase [Sphingobium chlorophenolicum]|uniref:Phenylacetic acid degradation-related protein n=1 Tax=Sphingobium chlorophenolicum TaxID=46429 RepID=A0A081RAE2_SPHCR|nr:PaaI family thioesterase [Sphingobium chlorophenolicum]KEQ52165.1 Phenylacetic acid degradation-related protein [Sphingobium chlorophenolicum]
MKTTNAGFGLVPPHVAASMSGVDLLRGVRDGMLPAPPFAECTNMWLSTIEVGEVTFVGEPTQGFYNPMGIIHGGWLATLLDSAMGSAVHSALQPGQAFATIDMSATFLKSVRANSGTISCTGKVLRLGQRVASAEGKMYDAKGELIAHGMETCLIFPIDQAAPSR